MNRQDKDVTVQDESRKATQSSRALSVAVRKPVVPKKPGSLIAPGGRRPDGGHTSIVQLTLSGAATEEKGLVRHVNYDQLSQTDDHINPASFSRGSIRLPRSSDAEQISSLIDDDDVNKKKAKDIPVLQPTRRNWDLGT